MSAIRSDIVFPDIAPAVCRPTTGVQMPGMSGVDLQSHLLRHGKDVPMIFITAVPEESIRRKVLAGGALGFLTKPFDGDAMVELIGQPLAQ